MTVNYIKHLNTAMSNFYKGGRRLHVTHMALYAALFHIWNLHHFQPEFPVIREDAMGFSRIGSRNTYLRCLKELHNCGLITYIPGIDVNNPAMISMTLWSDEGELLFDNSVDRVIFNTGGKNYGVRKERGTQPEIEHRAGSKESPSYKQYINNVKQERVNGLTLKKKEIKIPSQEEVEGYFNTNGLPQTEARKFFFYYQARGWSVKGSPIQDWESAARKWMLNTGLLSNEAATPGKLHVNQNKRYDIPL
jgi:hypothetical protein